MTFAAIEDTPYRIVLFLHILSVVVAFAPAVVHPLITARAKQAGGQEALQRTVDYAAFWSRRVYVPALALIGPLGAGMVLMSDDAFEFSQLWVWLAILLWLAIAGVVTGIIIPNERRLAAGDASAEKRVAAGGQAASILIVLVLYLMIWKPGL